MPAPFSEYNASTTRYRYGFNGKENDNEVKGQGNQQDYGMRIYDPRLGRFLSADPIAKDYPELATYQFASNTPIQAIDLDGLEAQYTTTGKLIMGPRSTDPSTGSPLRPLPPDWSFDKIIMNAKIEMANNQELFDQQQIFLTTKPSAPKIYANKSNGVRDKAGFVGVLLTPVQTVTTEMANNRVVLGISRKLNWIRQYTPKAGQTKLFTGNGSTWAFNMGNINKNLKYAGNLATALGYAGDVADYKSGNTGEARFAWQSTKTAIGIRLPWVGIALTLGELDKSSAFNELNRFFDDIDAKNRLEQQKRNDEKSKSPTIGPARNWFYETIL